MAEHKALQKALQQMAEGSRSAFRTFYIGSCQYVYSSSLLLYDSHEDACRFMVDFYQYLYLHLPEYDFSQNLESWISRLLMERYEQLSIGKHLTKPDIRQQMNSTTSPLSKSERERVWRMLDVNIHFPKESAHRSPVSVILLLSALILLLLVASRYVPIALERLQASERLLNSGATAESDESDKKTDEKQDDASDTEDPADELDSIKDELYDLTEQRADTEADNSVDDADDLRLQQSSRGTLDSDESKTPSTPSEPDTPQTPDQPREPQTPTLTEQSDTDSEPDSLEDLELHLHYGDTLLNAESN